MLKLLISCIGTRKQNFQVIKTNYRTEKNVKYFDSLSEKVWKIQTLSAFASSFAKAMADKKATDGQAIRKR